jgi:hypothetical protein
VEVTLRRPIDFAAEAAQQQAEVETIACLGSLAMENVTSDQRGIVAVETLIARDLSIRQSSGDIHALGPGTLETTRLDSGRALGARGAPRAATGQAGAAPNQPAYALVTFQREITGNLHHQQIVLHEDIRGVYGPVARFGDKLEMDPDKVGPQGATFRSDKLIVTQVGQRPHTTTELEAVGNTKVEGQTFTALAHKLTYVDGKGQLFLEGEGHNAARLFYQPQSGGAQTTARAQKIVYWPETGQVHVDKAESISAGQPGGPPTGEKRRQ